MKNDMGKYDIIRIFLFFIKKVFKSPYINYEK